MMKLNGLIITFMIFAVTINGQQKVTLEETINIALKKNLDIMIAKNDNKSVNNNINIGNAGLLPNVDLTVATTYNDNKINNGITSSNQSSTYNNVGLRASYTLFDGFKNYATYEKLISLGKISDYQTKGIIEQNIINVTTAFYQVASLTDQLNIQKESLNISKERLARTKNKKEYGQAKSVEYLSAQVDLNRDSVSYINSQTALMKSKQNLNNLLNREIDIEFEVDLEVNYKDVPSREELINLAHKNNIGINVKSESINLAESNMKSVNSNYLPKLTLDANYNYNKTNDEFEIGFEDKNRGFTTSINLSYNLFNGFRDDIQRQNAVIDLKNSELEQNKEILNLVTQISNTYKEYEDRKVSLKLEIDNLNSTELNFNRSRELYNLGNLTNTQFRESQLNLIQAKSNISSLKYSVKLYEAELERLAGILI